MIKLTLDMYVYIKNKFYYFCSKQEGKEGLMHSLKSKFSTEVFNKIDPINFNKFIKGNL